MSRNRYKQDDTMIGDRDSQLDLFHDHSVKHSKFVQEYELEEFDKDTNRVHPESPFDDSQRSELLLEDVSPVRGRRRPQIARMLSS